MAISYIGYEVDTSDYTSLLADIDAELVLENNELVEIGQRMALFIKERTGKGLDYEQKPFAKYSERYADFRDARGRNTDFVDLLFEGHMMANMFGFTDGSGDAIVEVLGAADKRKTHWHNEGTKLMPQRRFLDLDDAGPEAATLAEMAAFFMARRIEGL